MVIEGDRDAEAEKAIIARLARVREHHGKVPEALVRDAQRFTGLSERTIWRRIRQYEQHGDAGRTRRGYQLADEDKEAYVRLGGDVTAVYVERVARGLRSPSRVTLWRAFNDPDQFSAADRAYAREGAAGARKYRIALSWQPEHRNELWEADHKEIPVEVILRGRLVRPWITVFEDAKTRAIMGYSVNETQTAADVHAALRKGIEHHPERGPFCGMPDVCVWDGGKEFLARSVSDMCGRMGILGRPTPPRTPWLKGKVERLNDTFERSFLSKLPGYQGGPRRDDGTLYGTSDRLTMEHFLELVEEFIRAYNLDRPHDGLGGRTPQDVWLDDHSPLDVPDPERLRWLAQEKKRCKVTKHGVQIMRNTYKSAALEKLVNEHVEVRFMPHDARAIDVYFRNDFLGTLGPANAMTAVEQEELLAQRRRDAKEREKTRRRATRAQRVRFAPMTEPGPVEQTTVIDRERVRAEGDGRIDRDLSRQADPKLIRDDVQEGDGDVLPELDGLGASDASSGTPAERHDVDLLDELGVGDGVLPELDEEDVV